MTINYTAILGLAQPVNGTEAGTWGDAMNNGVTSLIDAAVSGAQTFAASGTMTTTTGAANTFRQAIIVVSGASSTVTLTAPALSKTYIVLNLSSYSTIVTAGSGSVTIVAGEYAVIACDGTNYYKVASQNGSAGAGSFTTLSASSTVSGTGFSTYLASPPAIGSTAASTGAFTSLSASSTVSGSAFNTYFASPPNIGGTAAAAGTFTSVTAPISTHLGTTSAFGSTVTSTAETVYPTASAISSTQALYVNNGLVQTFTVAATVNWVVNLAFSSGTTMNTALATNQAVTFAVAVLQGATPYYNTAVQIDGTATGVTTWWQGGAAPAAGNASQYDVYTYTVIKTAASTYTVFAAQTKF
jgi:hypothetical protein